VNSGRPRYDHELLGSSFAHNAELAAVVPQGPQNIVTPCHGADIMAVRNHYSEAIEILCSHDGCVSEWDFDGHVVHWGPSEA
jgi:hypothetical protein